MEISQYTGASLWPPRDAARDLQKTPISEISAITADPSSTSETEEDISLFDTLLDTVNPLQHIPGVSTAYQAISGDESSAVANMAGGFLFGGPIGLAAGAATSFFEMLTGKSIMEHAASFFEDEAPVPEEGGLEHIESASVQDNETLFKTATSLNVEQYQAYAAAQAAQNKGFGAQTNDVEWSSNIWMDNALKEADGLYESGQDSAKQSQNPQKQAV